MTTNQANINMKAEFFEIDQRQDEFILKSQYQVTVSRPCLKKLQELLQDNYKGETKTW